jgi:hypothetical protein
MLTGMFRPIVLRSLVFRFMTGGGDSKVKECYFFLHSLLFSITVSQTKGPSYVFGNLLML